VTSATDPTDTYTVATDGACKGNPGPTGWAWVGQDGHWAAGAIPVGTNNIGELMGLLKAIEDHADLAHLIVQADSKYAIDTYSSWMDAHCRRGWKTSPEHPPRTATCSNSSSPLATRGAAVFPTSCSSTSAGTADTS
jgi:ribonuclease HI